MSNEESNKNTWSLSMHQIECCNCSHGCGCQFSGFPDSESGSCEALIGFYIKSGHLNTLDLANIKVILAAAWPKAIHQGDGKAILFIDSAASLEQVAAIASIFTGQFGGMPFEALAGTFSELEGPIVTEIQMETDDKKSSFSIPDVIEVEHTPLINPMNGEDQNVHITYPDGGFFWNDGIIGTTKSMSIKHNMMSFNHVGHFAAKAEVNWSN
ncbi:DUF1326 domain-containing protein [Colwellia psychrerythraea]|uniref:DUF1326 domain-containing protein n=1 Tax=Colwellia psychrerythraea TaxID=28229 RepID=A0A099KP45_COLPS|nr:DUF1326 domain-containing protein [Colwellia psychrerythraea]KGJ92266.1 protein of unknown function DUF1326 [Colwellia psychrerythraea]